MSWWVSMRADLGGPEELSVYDSINMTYNVGPMLCEALGLERFDNLNGMTGEEAIPKIEKGINDMNTNRAKYDAMNPPNGWGSADGTLAFLYELLEMAEGAPKATFRVN